MRGDFCVFILTHRRPNKVKTYDTLKRAGYTGRLYLVIDDEDDTGEQYIEKFGDKVLVFSKEKVLSKFDKGNNFQKASGVIYARNACFDLARSVGCNYFIQLDDDYTGFWIRFTDALDYCSLQIFRVIDQVFESMVSFMESVPRCLSLCMSQSGDWIGGGWSGTGSSIGFKRKAMNTFVCDVRRPFIFNGEINEDVNTYVGGGSRGGLFLTFNGYQIIQTPTQHASGGMTEFYLNAGTYVKSFYAVMMNPSCVKIAEVAQYHHRLHHRIAWNNAVPKILREDIKAKL